MPSSSLHSPHLMELISQMRPSIAPRQQVMACVSQVLMQEDEGTAKRRRHFQEQSLSSAPNSLLHIPVLRAEALPLNALKTFQNHHAYLVKLTSCEHSWEARLTEQDKSSNRKKETTLQQPHSQSVEVMAHFHSSSRQTHFAGKGSSNLTSSKILLRPAVTLCFTESTFHFSTKVNPAHF